MKIISILIVLNLAVLPGFSQTPKTTETIHLNGIDMYYEVYGEGKPLILLHGWTQSSQNWKEYIDGYADNFEVYVPDLRGHGQSSSLSESFTIEKVAKDVLEFITILNIDKPKTIGLSFGGLVLLQLASSHPDKIGSMVLISASHNYNGQDNKELNDSFSFDSLPQEFIDQLRKTHFHGDDQIRALFNPELNYEIRITQEDLEGINTNTLIIGGDSDEIIGMDAAIKLHSGLPNSSLWVVPNAGHLPINEANKSEFLRITNEFLR